MKIGNINGSPEEIKNFLVDNGLDASDIIEISTKIHLKWIIIPMTLFILFSIILWIINNPPSIILGLLIIFEFLSISWLTASIHLKFKNFVASVICLLIFLAVFGVCLGIFDVKEAIETLQKIRPRTP